MLGTTVLIGDLIERVGGLLERVVEFIQFLGGIDVGRLLQFFYRRDGVIDVGGGFVNLSDGHDGFHVCCSGRSRRHELANRCEPARVILRLARLGLSNEDALGKSVATTKRELRGVFRNFASTPSTYGEPPTVFGGSGWSF